MRETSEPLQRLREIIEKAEVRRVLQPARRLRVPSPKQPKQAPKVGNDKRQALLA